MFALAIRYLNGWAMAAADGARKEQAEWPPHPDRVFMALAAAWFESGEDPAEGAALRWLEDQEAPAIAASDAAIRQSMGGARPTVSYVPTNDARTGRAAPADHDLRKLKEAGLAVLPEHRSRQPRAFPIAIPHDPLVHLIWRDAEPGAHLPALEHLARKVTHIGHSASFVQTWAHKDAVEATWVPVSGIAHCRLRVPCADRLAYLARRYNRDAVIAHADLSAQAAVLKGKEKMMIKAAISERFSDRSPVSLRPEPGRWQGYALRLSDPGPKVPRSIFDPQLVVLALSGKRVSLPATLKLTEALRGALMAACPVQSPPEWLSGHAPNGHPTSAPHIAFIPLPFVGSEHADGRIMGLGLALPDGLEPTDAAHCLGPFLHDPLTGLPRATTLFNGKWFQCRAEIATHESPPASLRAGAWTRQSRTWASVTPVVFDRHFEGKAKWNHAVEGVKDACERIGLPRPREVLLHPVSMVEGVAPARDFPQLTRKSDGGRRQHSHAVVVFEEAVRGPVLIGAGRFRGYGLCRPIDAEGRHD